MPDLPARYANGRFGPGNPGRPVGSYNRASRRAALAILDHFESIQGGFLERLSANNFALYIALLAKVLPRQIEVGSPVADTLPEDDVGPAFAVWSQPLVRCRPAALAVLRVQGTPCLRHSSSAQLPMGHALNWAGTLTA